MPFQIMDMTWIIAVAVFLATSVQCAIAVPSPVELTTRDTTPSTSKIQADLGPKLCQGGSIYFPSSPEFGEYTTRWSTAAEGNILVVVVPACEKDVATAVKFANLVDIPFLAINRGHGSAGALGTIKNGLLIRLDNLDAIHIAADGNSATMGGGVYVDQVLATLAEKNKVCATGTCGCVGIVGPGLGGGFGWYMGYAGLMTDNIIEMNVVTADGSQVKVSESSNNDLYWGMRGAGHNFGIVTSFKYKIFDYPRGQDTYYVNYFYTEDKLEAVFSQLNKLLDNGKLPRDFNAYVVYIANPDLNPMPVLSFQLQHFGTAAEALPLVQPFLDLGPILAKNATTVYKNYAHEAIRAGVGDPICAPGSSKAQFPVGLKEYNIHANRKAYSLFADMVAENPDFAGSIMQFEGYAVQGMKAVDPASSAYAHRDDNILVSLTAFYPPGAENDGKVAQYGRRARQLWIEGEKGREFTAYTNYAYGDESLESIYGYEPWRLQRLRALKKKWDPKGKFNFYNPIS